MDWIAHDWSWLHMGRRKFCAHSFQGMPGCGDHQLSVWNTYMLLLLNTKSTWLSRTCCTKANPDLNPLFEMLQSIQRLGTEPSEKMLTVARIKLSTLSSSFMSCQRFQDFSRPPQLPMLTNKSNNIPWKPSLYHRAEQLLESLPATCGLQKLPFRKTQHGD